MYGWRSRSDSEGAPSLLDGSGSGHCRIQTRLTGSRVLVLFLATVRANHWDGSVG